MTVVATPEGGVFHDLGLTHHRSVRFDRGEHGWRVAYYWPDADKRELQQLAVRANRGDWQAMQRLRSLPRRRATAVNVDLHTALQLAIIQQTNDETRARKVADDVLAYAEYVGWV